MPHVCPVNEVRGGVGGPAVFLRHRAEHSGAAAASGDIVLCEMSVSCNPATTVNLWCDPIRLSAFTFVGRPTLLVEFISNGPGSTFDSSTLSSNAQFFSELCCQNGGETVIYTATTQFSTGSSDSNVFRIESDASGNGEVPEPSAVLLLGTGFIPPACKHRRTRPLRE
jgi:hypothetical protein